jgi:2-polyprenyl-6-methoxyphenol hydroxylase-like FAD-dependent oxidoreductase
MYDAIIVGARVAGASTAMLMARRGLKVLVVDRAQFPSDTLSTHQVQVPGVARLRRWGLLDDVIAAGTPPTRDVSFDLGPVVLRGRWPEFEGADALFSPRRTILDALLVAAARAAGAEVRERFKVDEILFEDGRVSGIRARGVREKARLVVGADGRHSLVAKAVRPAAYRAIPPRSVAYYTYWTGVPGEAGRMYMRGDRAIGAWPTNDGLVMTYVAAPASAFATFKADPEGALREALDRTGELGEQIRAGERADRVFGTADLPNRFHTPFGPGWALVGDAGLLMDPITGQGISQAFRDAELLADAVASGSPLEDYQRARDADAQPIYDMTVDLASFAPPQVRQQLLFDALAARPEEVDRFFGVLNGSVPSGEYFAPRNLLRLLGPRGFMKAAVIGGRMAA